MKFVITESQNNFLWLLRRLRDRDMLDHIHDIIVEGFDYINACHHQDDFSEYKDDIIFGAVETFINSYDDKFTGTEGIDELKKYITNYIDKIFGKMIREHYDYELEDCEDPINYV